ncbi:hypothetical protein CARUB_v10010270mg [Capsella rubella]|uniref:Uncharacterized protein n=1 Tax=Capsella rubella TaxID=81985 RepID=R0GRI2_9BRAS|nr:uncharacterized protein LOC17898759 [Capsella rubella]EOA38502.1 hypothetical protein CARUB_v10010270mg [Capsella rubella]
MLLAVEGGGLFSASASGYSKGLTLLFSGDKDGDRPMRVVPWNQYRVVDQEPEADDSILQLDSIKNRVSRGCAASFSCFGGASAGLETPSPLKVEPVQQQHPEISTPESGLVVSEQGKDHISEADNNSSKEAFKLSLRSSLKRPSVAEPRSLEDIKEYETLSVDGSDLTGDMARRKVQWPDACGSELTQVREFEPSEMGLSDDEWETGQQRTCSCVIM